MKNKLSIRTSLTQLVLPIVGVQNVVKLEQIKHLESVIKEQSIFTFDQWMNKASCETDVAEHLLRLVYNISADYMNRLGETQTKKKNQKVATKSPSTSILVIKIIAFFTIFKSYFQVWKASYLVTGVCSFPSEYLSEEKTFIG